MRDINEIINQVIHGDCLEVLKEIPDESVDLVFADEPYGISHKKQFINEGKKYKSIHEQWDIQLVNRIWVDECVRILKRGGAIYSTGTYHNIFTLKENFDNNKDLVFRNFITWFKPDSMPSLLAKQTGFYAYSCEYILYYTKGKTKTFNYDILKEMNGGKQMRDLWIINNIKDRKYKHPAQKPIKLLERIILASSNEGDIVLDPFFGSGTTGVVAKKLGRNFIGIEQNPEYVKLARRRLQEIPENLFVRG